jgi:putative ABC transport system permease protein
MTLGSLIKFSLASLNGHRLRTGLSLLGVMIGVAAVLVLTALGEGARRYVTDQFSSLGTNLLVVLPGKTETSGLVGFGGIPNDLTLQDAQAVARRTRSAERVAPLTIGTEEIEYQGHRRQVAIIGSTAEYQLARQLTVDRGDFLPRGDWSRGTPVAVLGRKAASELFGAESPVGKVIRVGEWRIRVIGLLSPQGVKMGLDFDDMAIIPVATAMQMFNRRSLFRILVQTYSHADLEKAKNDVRSILTERHQEEDITVVTQDAVLSTFSAVLQALTLALAAIAAVSLSVAGIGIMNVMLVSVSERTQEIGLLKSLGVARGQILAVFLTEAGLISTAGGLLGLSLGWILVQILVHLYPDLPASSPTWAVVAALTTSVVVGLIFGILPARTATKLDPIEALGRR